MLVRRLLYCCLFFFVAAYFTGVANACTSAIVSGKCTPDGRPLLWKNRDTGTLQNFVDRVSPSDSLSMAYVALFNAGDTLREQAWIGVNEASFAIMNTASYNLAPDTARVRDREGYVMARALGRCRTLADFEQLLDTLQRPLGVQANFGVVDASGQGAFYETCDTGYVRFLLSDSPTGVLIRTNFSVSGEPDGGYGYIVAGAQLLKLLPECLLHNFSPTRCRAAFIIRYTDMMCLRTRTAPNGLLTRTLFRAIALRPVWWLFAARIFPTHGSLLCGVPLDIRLALLHRHVRFTMLRLACNPAGARGWLRRVLSQ